MSNMILVLGNNTDAEVTHDGIIHLCQKQSATLNHVMLTREQLVKLALETHILSDLFTAGKLVCPMTMMK